MRSMRFHILLVLLLISAQTAGAQKFPGWAHHDNANATLSVVEIGDVVWVGTTVGLVRFESKTDRATTYTRWNSPLPSNWVQRLSADSLHRLWIGTGAGLTMLDGDKWTRYDTTTEGAFAPGISSISIGGDGTVWAAGGGRLLRLDGPAWHVYSDGDSTVAVTKVTCVVAMSDGSTWVGTDQWGIFRVKGEQWEEKGFNTSPYTITNLTVTPDGTLWAGISIPSGIVMRYNGTAWSRYSYPTPPGLEIPMINALPLLATPT